MFQAEIKKSNGHSDCFPNCSCCAREELNECTFQPQRMLEAKPMRGAFQRACWKHIIINIDLRARGNAAGV